MGRVQDKVAIVTGGARGLGKATGILPAQEGAHVTIVDIEDEPGTDTAREMLHTPYPFLRRTSRNLSPAASSWSMAVCRLVTPGPHSSLE